MKASYPSDPSDGVFQNAKSIENRPSKVPHVLSDAFPVLLILSVVIGGCSNPASKLPVIYSFQGLHTHFVNQDGLPVEFPSKYKGHLFVMDAIYTHCTDVCPETTDNLRDLRDSLKAIGIGGVKFVTLTYDPNRDTPSALKEFGEKQNVSFRNWDFLTGTTANIDSALGRVKIKYSYEDSTYNKQGKLEYDVLHPDECLLVDGKGRVRGIYGGSDLHLPSIIKDIKILQ